MDDRRDDNQTALLLSSAPRRNGFRSISGGLLQGLPNPLSRDKGWRPSELRFGPRR
jgi:hypothetical protein